MYFQLPTNLSLLLKKYIQTVFCIPETIQYSRDVKLHFSTCDCVKQCCPPQKTNADYNSGVAALQKLPRPQIY